MPATQLKLQFIEWITLNLLSIVYIFAGLYSEIPNWLLVLIGLSIVFYNIARGIKALRNKHNKNN